LVVRNRPSRLVSDAGPLIHLHELDLDLLTDSVLVPDAVWEEVERHQPTALRAECLKRVADPSPVDPTLEALALGLGLGSGDVGAATEQVRRARVP
jgi:hypothetical protein